MTYDHPSDPLDPHRKAADAADRQWVQILGRSAPFAGRMVREVLNHSRRMQEDLRCLGDADPSFELPSLREILTIEQFGYPRTYNLNDGMGQE